MGKQQTRIALDKQASDFFDWTSFLTTMLLVAMGLISIYSATYDSGMSVFFNRQIIYTFVGTVAMFVIMFISDKLLYMYSFTMYLASIILLILVFPFGKDVYGTRGWLDIGIMTLQPSEFAKFTTLLMLANHLSKRGTDIRTWRDFSISALIVLIPAGLILAEPDTGSASVLMALFLGILLWSGFDLFTLYFVVSAPVMIIASLISKTHFIVMSSLFGITSFFFRKNMVYTFFAIGVIVSLGYFSPIIVKNLAPHQQARIHTFIHPEDDPRGKGYNVIQSVMAVGSGGLVGKGFLQGTQTQLRYIPKQWTDFIFCVPTEEFGFIGGTLVIVLIGGLIYRCITVASMTTNPFMSILCIGVATIFIYHTLINIGMAIGLMPVMGIPLPFMSAGGSSLIVNMALVGLVLNAYRSHQKKLFDNYTKI